MHERISIAALALTATAACLPATAVTVGAEVEKERFAVVTAEAMVARTSSEVPAFELNAFFVEADGVGRASLANALDLWTAPTEEGCVAVFPEAPASDASVEFLSAGQIGVSGNGSTAAVQPSLFAGGARMTGFSYVHSPDGPAYAAGETYTLWASGDAVGSFAATLDAPGYVQLIAVDGRELGSVDEFEVSGDRVVVDLFTDAETIFVSLAPTDDVGRGSIECRFDGVQQVDFDLAEVDAVLGQSGELELSVRTASSAPLPSSVGIDGEAQMVFFDRLRLLR